MLFLASCALRDGVVPSLAVAPDVALAEGYRIEVIAAGLASPRGVTFDNAGGVYVLEAGRADGGGSRVVRLGLGGARTAVMTSDTAWTGVTWHQGGFLVAEGGVAGRILHLDPEAPPGSEPLAVAEGVPACGPFATDLPVLGPDGWLYFGRGIPEEGGTTCTRGLFRARPDGGDVEPIAAGFPNPFQVAFAADGCLYVADTGGGDQVWEVEPGAWYGRPEANALATPAEAPQPAVLLETSPRGIDFARSADFGGADVAFVATHDAAGPRILRVDPDAGTFQPFAANKGSTATLGRGLGRPVAVRFDPTGRSLYVVDAGIPAASGAGAVPGTGALWRIWRER